MSVTQAAPSAPKSRYAEIARKYMLCLELATFDRTDATLVPAAGACTTCEFRTGNQRESRSARPTSPAASPMRLIEGMKDAAELRAIAIELRAADSAVGYGNNVGDQLRELAKLFGVDLVKPLEAAKKAAAAKAKEAPPAKAKKAAGRRG